MKFEVKMANRIERAVRKQCWKRWGKQTGLESAMDKDRKEFLEKMEWLKEEWKNAIKNLEKP